MKKIGKILLLVIGAVVAVIAGVMVFVAVRGIPTYEPETVEMQVIVTPEKVQNGFKLASMVCNHCHSSPNSSQLIGRKVEDIDPAFGTVYSMNITQHPEKGIGKWTDGELAYFLRTGIRPDGSFAPPYMPKFPLLSDYDMESIIAYLKSDHITVQANEEEPPPSEPSFLTKFLTNFVIKPNPYPEGAMPSPDTTDLLAYGQYLATAQLGCYECHSASFPTNNNLQPELSKGFMGGGNKLFDMEGKPVFSPNITFDGTTGIGEWTEAQFLETVKWGRRADGTTIQYPMMPYTRLTDTEVKAIYAYLKTVPAIHNDVAAILQ